MTAMVSTTACDSARLRDARSALARLRDYLHRVYYANSVAYVAGCKRLKMPDVYPFYLPVNREIQELINQETGLTRATIHGFRRNLMRFGRWPARLSEAVRRACHRLTEKDVENSLIPVSLMNSEQILIYLRLREILGDDPDADLLARFAVSRNI